MNTPTLRVWQVSDQEWWVGAGTADDIRQAVLDATGVDPADPENGDPAYPFVLDDDDLDRLRLAVCDEDDNPTGETITFREALEEAIAEGVSEPQFFAGVDA